MTAPSDFRFVDESATAPNGQSAPLQPPPPIEGTPPEGEPLPPPILAVSEQKKDELRQWLDEHLDDLIAEQAQKQKEWATYEEAYRARPEPYKTEPFEGACNEVIPVIAMAVDPVVARLFTGIFKQDPTFTIKALKKQFVEIMPALNKWVDYYQKNRLRLGPIMQPRLHEFANLGTCHVKTVYDVEKAKVQTYDENWNVVEKEVTRFKGPRVLGVPLGNLLFGAGYQRLQDCPIVAERQRVTYHQLKEAEHSGKLANVDKLKGESDPERTDLESAQQHAARHEELSIQKRATEIALIEIFEVWCDYDINGDGMAEKIVVTYHKHTRTILQLRYNWYFHQRKPYTLMPYGVVAGSMWGLGLGEAIYPFQLAITNWHQMASDNAYLANIRMFIAKKDAGIEEVPRLYTGRTFFVDKPKEDFLPFAAAEVYPSTLTERQNLLGLVEKRTGVSDYLTGRESPIIGSRATATSTLALIEQGTKRVEQVLENLRIGLGEVIENCLYLWIQYGLDDLDELVFGDDQISDDLRKFFSSVSAENVNGAIAVDLTATDASGSRQVLQQMQLQIIQVMMQYLEKLLEAGQAAIMANREGVPEYAEMVKDVMTAARSMFKDLLLKYDIRNPEEYLPALEEYLDGVAQGQGGLGGPPSGAAGPQGQLGQPARPSIPSGQSPVDISTAGGVGGAGTVPVPPGIPQRAQGIIRGA